MRRFEKTIANHGKNWQLRQEEKELFYETFYSIRGFNRVEHPVTPKRFGVI